MNVSTCRVRERRTHHRRGIGVASVGMLLIGCSDDGKVASAPATVRPATASVSRYMSDTSRALLDDSGRFVLASIGNKSAAGREIIAEDRARALAAALAKRFDGSILRIVEREHAASILPEALHACGRTFYAESPVGDLPAEIPSVVRRFYGPQWIVTLCDVVGPAVSVAVSAYSTDLAISKGDLQYPELSGGGYFKWLGIPPGMSALPMTPEDAVAAVAVASGTKVTQAPTLIAPLPSEFPQMARWRVSLSRGVAIQSLVNAVKSDAAELYVGRQLLSEPISFYKPAAGSPKTLQISYQASVRRGDPRGPRAPMQQASMPVEAGAPVKLERVQVSGGAQ
jgi:hypothetical protein